MIDAKSCYDALSKGGSAPARDRRTAIELAIIAETLSHHKAKVKWVPHGLMAVNPLTKADIGSANAALYDLLRSGMLCLVDESLEITARREGTSSKSRSQKASRDMLSSNLAEFPVGGLHFHPGLESSLGGGSPGIPGDPVLKREQTC